MKNIIFVPDENDLFICDEKNFKHSGDLGDIIYSLPAMKYFGGGNLYLVENGLSSTKYDGSSSGLDSKKIDIIKPLLETLSYIKNVEKFNFCKRDINIDFDLFRYKGNDRKNLCEKILETFKVPLWYANEPWLQVAAKNKYPVVINRTKRYRNNNLDYRIILNKFKDAVFIGHAEEHADFQNTFGDIPHVETPDLLDAAEIIAGSELFIGNQSACLAVAVGLGVNIWQEYYPKHADCIFNRENCAYLYVGN